MYKRNRRPVVRPGYLVGQEAVDAWFMEEYEITEDELNAFDDQHSTVVTVSQ